MEENHDDPQFRAAYLKANFESAQRTHALHDELWQFSLKSTVQFALEALRAAALINGGAVVASLAFAGAVFQDETAAGQMLLAAEQFSYGVISVGIATALAYIAQYLYTIAYAKADKTYEYEDKYLIWARSRKFLIPAYALHLAAAALTALSYAFLYFGVLEARNVLPS